MPTIVNNGLNASFTGDLPSIPAAGDNLQITKGAVKYSTNTSLANNLLQLIMGGAFAGEFAGSLLSVQVDFSGAAYVEISSAGRVIKATAGGPLLEWNRLIFRAPSTTLEFSNGTIPTLEQFAGTIIAASDADINAVIVGGGSLSLLDSSAVTNSISVTGNGRVVCNRPIGASGVAIGGQGHLTIETDQTAATVGSDINVRAGGSLVYAGGAITGALNLEAGGMIDFRGLKNNIAISASSTQSEGAVIYLPPTGITVTYSSGRSLVGRGPREVPYGL